MSRAVDIGLSSGWYCLQGHDYRKVRDGEWECWRCHSKPWKNPDEVADRGSADA